MGASTHKQVDSAITVSETTPIKICLIGAGNVASHLARALDKVADIIQIYSHSYDNSAKLAGSIGKPHIATDSLKHITTDADYYIVSVKDDHIAEVANITPDHGIWAHTSGSIPMSVFEGIKTQYGVFYPLQTFSKNVELDITKVPFFIEGNNNTVANLLTELAGKISNIVEPADSKRRKALHIAAVFACNFVNYMWIQADDLLKREGLDISFMKPLLEETLNKIGNTSPTNAQTGPARRGDTRIIDDHLSQLNGEQRDIYSLISKLIMKHYHNE